MVSASSVGILFCMNILECCAGRSEFGHRGTRRSQTARAWPRAAQHKLIAFLIEIFLLMFGDLKQGNKPSNNE